MKVRIHLTGTTPLLMHSAVTVDPLHEKTQAIRAITSKRKKTDDDHAEIARLEFHAGMYYDPDAGPYVPGWNIFKTLQEGAKLTKAGMKVARGLVINDEVNPLVYKGPRTLEELWTARFYLTTSVRVSTARTIRCRPQFPAGWQVETDGTLDTKVLSLPELRSLAEDAGSMVGLGDWRPRYGKFSAVVEEL